MAVAGSLACVVAVWLAACALLAPRLPHHRLVHPEEQHLREAGWRWPARRWELLRVAVAASAGLVAWLTGWDPGPPAAVALALPSAAVRVRSASRREQRRRAALVHFRLIAAALAGGAGLVEAIRRAVAGERDVLAATPLTRALHAFSVGASLSDGLRAGAASAHPRTRPALLTLALGVEERLPVARLRVLVEAAAERLAFDEEIETEVRARASGTRLQIWAMAAVVPLLGMYLIVTVPLVADVLGSDLGRHLLVPAAGALEVTGFLLARRAVRDVAA